MFKYIDFSIFIPETKFLINLVLEIKIIELLLDYY